ncbi:acetolactate decarboxylase [Chitinophaga jiangningensis]|uniref:Alpha-acetolactate decarboxylase n=1 Tax=Chitinophaga jiangningensis TaxID=1419482 RepID=A0A1M7L612_9BACT|nr:acetolactate decarboxylase [Chitinophaga jiangningensis]SHM73558.1 acetolactate decarboxylase [Chitinophaga jiangningensis]
MKKYLILLLVGIALHQHGNAQQAKPHHLFTAGVASGLMGGLFEGFYPVSKLLQHGNFGLGAPDKIDGELLVLNGVAYQTTSTGATRVLPGNHLVSFAMVHPFVTKRRLRAPAVISKSMFFTMLDTLMPQKNGLYAVHIKGRFKYLKTRAFPPVTSHPYPTLASMIPQQKFFEFENIEGELVGYRLPAYMDNTNISGYHFHFLSADKKHGGHIVDLTLSGVTIEIDQLESYTVELPDTEEFRHFDFHQNRAEDIKQVERGSKE